MRNDATYFLFTLHPDHADLQEDIQRFPWCEFVKEKQTLFARANLIDYLARAIGTPAASITQILDDEDYILTEGFTKKMIEIHDRRLCGVSTIIEGETGVGKSELLRMYSLIVNSKGSRPGLIARALEGLYGRVFSILPQSYGADFLEKFQKATQCKEKGLTKLLNDYFFDENLLESQPVTSDEIRQFLTSLGGLLADFVRSYPDFDVDFAGPYGHPSLNALAQIENSRQHPVFYKLGVYGEQSLAFIENWMDPIISLAKLLREVHKEDAPVLTVFFDELNTSSCLSVYKEIMVDRRLNSMPLPVNLFFVAAINPLRSSAPVDPGAAAAGSGDDDLEEKDGVPSSTIARNNLDQYLVRDLPASMHHLKWTWGALKGNALNDYTSLKLRKVFKQWSPLQLSGPESSDLTTLVIAAHNWTRDQACESSVSQRDVQRCFNLWGWFVTVMPKLWSSCNCEDCQLASTRYKDNDPMNGRRKWAMVLAISLTYYACRTADLRDALAKKMKDLINSKMQLQEIYLREVNFFLKHTRIPQGIAPTPALAENIFILVVSIVNKMPLLIVGEV